MVVVSKMGWDVKSHSDANLHFCKFVNENNYKLKIWSFEFWNVWLFQEKQT
jgi:hypothetical protein